MKFRKTLIKFLALTALFSCTLEPRYKTPKVDLPLKENVENKDITLISWQNYFQSPDLQRVIQLALDNNRDLRTANLNIEIAQANYGITRSDLLPKISASASKTSQKAPKAFASFMPKEQYRASLAVTSYEVDFFGRIRSLNKAAMEDMLSTTEARNVIKITLIAETANLYTQLLLDRQTMQLAKENLDEQEKLFSYAQARQKSGIDSQDDLMTSLATLENARAAYESYAKIVKQDQTSLMALTGVFDESQLPQNNDLSEVKINEESLNLLPSESLLNRPDIQQAEHNLKAANANIGAARAAFFPSITLTGTYGYNSRTLEKFKNSRSWSYTPQINLPIFSAGQNYYNLKAADLRKKAEIVDYEKAIQNAFKETANQLAEREAASNRLKSYDQILQSRQKIFDITKHKHLRGISSANDISNNKIALLTAKQNKATSQKEYLTSLINLYKTLGGGSRAEN